MTPRDMRMHNPILVFLLIWTFRRKMHGKAAHTKSVTMDKTAGEKSVKQHFDDNGGSIPPWAMTIDST